MVIRVDGEKDVGELPNRIREWRNRRRLSLAELGEATGFSRSEISKLESGARRVRADHMVALARALGIHPDELFEASSDISMSAAPAAEAERPGRASVPLLAAKGTAMALHLELGASMVECPPSLGEGGGAYAFYMPDTSLEPRVPVGARVYVHPMLPPRPGDLAVVRMAEGVALGTVERGLSSLVIRVPGRGEISLGDGGVMAAERVVGLWLG